MKGLMSIRAAKALIKYDGLYSEAIKATQSNDPQVSKFLEKSFVPGVTTEDILELAGQAVARELGEYIFSQSVPGKMIAYAYQLPFNSPLNSISGIGAGWIEEGKAIPVRRGSVSQDKLQAFKIASMVVVSNELLRLSATGSDIAIRNAMTSEAIKKIDAKFLSADPEVADTSPAGMLLGATQASIFLDMFEKHVANGNSLNTSFLILPFRSVMGLTDAEFKQFDLLGVKLLASQYSTQTALIDAGNTIINVQGTLVDVARQGTVEMTDTPVNTVTEESGAEMVSLYQTNSTGLRAITYCSWSPAGKPVTVLQSGL